MTKLERFLAALPGLALFFAACSEGKQPVSGTVAQESFSSPITTVTASRTDATSTSASVAADGTFTLNLPKGSGYRLDFASAAGDTTLVFPRSGGAVEWRFDVTSTGSTFDLGTVRQVGDPRKLNVTFAHTKMKHGDGGVEGDEVACLNGLDPTTGAVCVEDNDDQGLACKGKGGKHGKGKGHGKAKGHGDGDAGCHKRHVCEDDAGVCQGDGDGDGHHGHDGGVDDDDPTTGTDTGSATGEATPSSAAVADRNLPASLGACSDRDETDDDK
jgi:hypothetical protein